MHDRDPARGPPPGAGPWPAPGSSGGPAAGGTGAEHRVGRRRWLLAALAVPHLLQGSPTSPALANLVAHGLDRRLTGPGRPPGATYTATPTTWCSSGGRDLARRADAVTAAVATGIVEDEGFRLHMGKTQPARPPSARSSPAWS